MGEPAAGGVLLGVHVLVADADAETRHLLEAVLTYCGALVTHAGSAPDVVQLVRRYRPDVVVTALAVAGDDGALVRQLRDLGPDVVTPVVAVTGSDDASDGILQAGFAAHVRKPLDPWALCRLLASLVRRP
jgi:CheY-like chemotaxis protein